MDSSSFIQLVHGTPLLTEEQKMQYVAEAATYTPETRAEMAAVIREEEDSFLAAVAAREHAEAATARMTTQHLLEDLRAKEVLSHRQDEADLARLTEAMRSVA